MRLPQCKVYSYNREATASCQHPAAHLLTQQQAPWLTAGAESCSKDYARCGYADAFRRRYTARQDAYTITLISAADHCRRQRITGTGAALCSGGGGNKRGGTQPSLPASLDFVFCRTFLAFSFPCLSRVWSARASALSNTLF